MNRQNKKYIIKIPEDTMLFYSEKKQVLTIAGPIKRRSIKLPLRLLIDKMKKSIKVSSLAFSQISNKDKKKIKILRGTTVALIKQLLVETSTLISQKLKFVGMGYRINNTEDLTDEVLSFKLGYSHLVYFRIPTHLNISCFTKTKLCVSGNSYQEVTQIAASIRSCRLPE